MNATQPLSADGIASPPGALQRHVAAVGDDAGMSALRRRALALADGTDWSRCSDHQVVAALGVAAARFGADQGGPPPKLLRLAVAATAAAAPAAATPAARRAAAAPVAAAVDDAAFPASLDAAAMAQGLIDAARDGLPFCEECAAAQAAG